MPPQECFGLGLQTQAANAAPHQEPQPTCLPHSLSAVRQACPGAGGSLTTVVRTGPAGGGGVGVAAARPRALGSAEGGGGVASGGSGCCSWAAMVRAMGRGSPMTTCGVEGVGAGAGAV